MSALNIKFSNISFSYPGSPEPVFRGVHTHFRRGWTGIVGSKWSGKTTLARLTGKDRKGSRQARLMEERVSRAEREVANYFVPGVKPKGVLFQGNRSRRDYLMHFGPEVLSLDPVSPRPSGRHSPAGGPSKNR